MSKKKNPWKNLTEAQKEAIAKVFADAWLSLPRRAKGAE